jgi:hypothetical protein
VPRGKLDLRSCLEQNIEKQRKRGKTQEWRELEEQNRRNPKQRNDNLDVLGMKNIKHMN